MTADQAESLAKWSFALFCLLATFRLARIGLRALRTREHIERRERHVGDDARLWGWIYIIAAVVGGGLALFLLIASS
jgi:hypothetical protein